MAKKPPETVDRFRVVCEIPRTQLGDVIAELTKLGVQHVQHELVTDVLDYKQPKKFDVPSTDIMREYIKNHATFTRQDVITYFAEQGRDKGRASNALYVLARDKEIIMLGEGNYQRADVKAISGPKKAKPKAKTTDQKLPKKKKAASEHVGRYDVSNADLVLQAFRARKRFRLQEAENLLEKNGRPGKSASPVLLKLVNDRKMHRLGQGEYEVSKSPAGKKKAVAHVNGAAGEPITGSTKEGVTDGA